MCQLLFVVGVLPDGRQRQLFFSRVPQSLPPTAGRLSPLFFGWQRPVGIPQAFAVRQPAAKCALLTSHQKTKNLSQCKTRSLLLSLFLALGCLSNSAVATVAVLAAHKNSTGVMLRMNPGTLRLEVYSPRIIRVTYALENPLPPDKSPAVIAHPERSIGNWSNPQPTPTILIYSGLRSSLHDANAKTSHSAS